MHDQRVKALRAELDARELWYRARVFVRFRTYVKTLSARSTYVPFILKTKDGRELAVCPVNGNESAYRRVLVATALAQVGLVVEWIHADEDARTALGRLDDRYSLRRRSEVRQDVESALQEIRGQVNSNPDEVR